MIRGESLLTGLVGLDSEIDTTGVTLCYVHRVLCFVKQQHVFDICGEIRILNLLTVEDGLMLAKANP